MLEKCEVCNKNAPTDVLSIPGVPMSCCYCKECIEANAHPYWIVVVNTALAQSLDNCIEEWKEIVRCTCKHLNKSIEEFNQDVNETIKELKLFNEK